MADYSWAEYVDLISDASTELYEKNHGSSFTNRLVVPQELPEHCWVAAREFEYVNTFYNVKEHKNVMAIFDWLYEHPPNTPPRNPNAYSTYGKMIACTIKKGYYDSSEKMCEMFNQVLKDSKVSELQKRDVFSYDATSMKFSFDLEGLYVSLFIRGDLLNFLGIEQSKATVAQYVVLGRPKLTPTYTIKVPDPLNPDIMIDEVRHLDNPKQTWKSGKEHKGEFEYAGQLTLVTSFIVYINIIESQVTGDVFSDALRVIPINKHDQGSTIIVKFDTPYFLKVNKRHIPSITVQVRSLEGDLINFLVGRTRLKLQFTTKP